MGNRARVGLGSIGWLVVGCMVLTFFAGDPATAGPKPKHEVDLKIEGIPKWANLDSYDPLEHPLLVGGGWPITFVMKAKHEFQGFGSPTPHPDYPTVGTTFPWVFGEPAFGPDGCPSWSALQQGDSTEFPDCILGDGLPDFDPWPIDETLVPFTPGLNAPGWCSNFCPVGETCPVCEVRPTVPAQSPGTCDPAPCDPPAPTEVGPLLGTGNDDYRYGQNARLPGLVITADAGPGVVTDASFDRTGQCRNLAGMVQSVSYVLSDYAYDTELWAHLNVPTGLFTPVALVDPDFDGSCDFDGDLVADDGTATRIDGGPLECREGTQYWMISLARDQLVTLRAFVVNVDENGNGPDMLEDLTGDGICDAADAESMGLQLLSREVQFRFSLYLQLETALRFDFDGDQDLGGFVAPAGSGGVRQPPR